MIVDARYWVTRDENASGQLSSEATLWSNKPERRKANNGVYWVDIDPTQSGRLGDYSLDDVRRWFRTVPDTSLECIVAHTQQDQK